MCFLLYLNIVPIKQTIDRRDLGAKHTHTRRKKFVAKSFMTFSPHCACDDADEVQEEEGIKGNVYLLIWFQLLIPIH